jgi:hypothetical protein
MGYQKPAYIVVRERLACWYLFAPKTFTPTLEQMAELLEGMSAPARIGWDDKRDKVNQFLKHLQGIAEGKKSGNFTMLTPEEQECSSDK